MLAGGVTGTVRAATSVVPVRSAAASLRGRRPTVGTPCARFGNTIPGSLLRQVAGYTPAKIAEVFRTWNQEPLKSYLIEITAEILAHNNLSTGSPFVGIVADAAAQKGAGNWPVQTALDVADLNWLERQRPSCRLTRLRGTAPSGRGAPTPLRHRGR